MDLEMKRPPLMVAPTWGDFARWMGYGREELPPVISETVKAWRLEKEQRELSGRFLKIFKNIPSNYTKYRIGFLILQSTGYWKDFKSYLILSYPNSNPDNQTQLKNSPKQQAHEAICTICPRKMIICTCCTKMNSTIASSIQPTRYAPDPPASRHARPRPTSFCHSHLQR